MALDFRWTVNGFKSQGMKWRVSIALNRAWGWLRHVRVCLTNSVPAMLQRHGDSQLHIRLSLFEHRFLLNVLESGDIDHCGRLLSHHFRERAGKHVPSYLRYLPEWKSREAAHQPIDAAIQRRLATQNARSTASVGFKNDMSYIQ